MKTGTDRKKMYGGTLVSIPMPFFYTFFCGLLLTISFIKVNKCRKTFFFMDLVVVNCKLRKIRIALFPNVHDFIPDIKTLH